MQSFNGIVKAVLSGDSLIVMGLDASRGPPPEKLISLNSVTAPRLGNKNTPDAPHAWGAREFLRRETIGKKVSFQLEPQVPGAATNRSFGSVFLEDGTSLATLLVTSGWAKPRPNAPPELVEAMTIAEAQGLGSWGSAAGAVRDVQYAGTFDTEALQKRCNRVPQEAIIEQVVSGSSLRVLLLPSFHQITLMLSGIQCGSIRRLDDGTEDAQPFAREGRYFVETRLLNRDVKVSLEGVDKNGNLLGTVLHPAGNMSIELVKVGLARVVDWSTQVCPHAPALRAAERSAKEKRLRIWKDYVPPNAGSDMAEYAARVIEVFSGDTLIVLDSENVEKRISLSSLSLRPKPAADAAEAREPHKAPFAAESKEMLRKLVIGKKVRVVPEYKRTFNPVGGNAPTERTFGTVWFGTDKNAAVAILSEGLAVVSRHGQSEERSLHYETLLEAEEAAKTAKKGMHAGGEPPRSSVTDLTTPDSRERAKRFLSALQRHGRTRGVVQFVPNGTRFKIQILKENCIVSFACIGIRCPQCARRDTGSGGEPFGEEAAAFARQHCMQRDVDIEVETVDKNGTFLGSLFLSDKRNYSVALLEEGLAKRVQPAADRSTCGAELATAEETAKAANKALWENYSAEADEAAVAAATAAALAEQEPTPDEQKQMVDIELTEIVDGAHFYAHVAGDSNVSSLQTKLAASCSKSGPADAEFEPKPGQTCCARFTSDNEWYRAKVVSRSGAEFTVFFVDYGNTDVVSRDRLKPLDPSLGIQLLSAQAVECRLAHMIASPATDQADGEEAAIYLSQVAWGKPMLARVEDRNAGVLLVTLIDPVDQSNINEALVEAGLLRVAKTFEKRAAPLVRALREKELLAKKGRHGMWRFGDIEEDDDFEFGMRNRENPAANPWKK
uniref:Uncharacterized protein n=1 Tax=Haptolina brevifila TaxID=156173 RepID=A0A7S2GFY6_9EUKA|mmetsp:Transcript_36861/g.73495  ORF Transcript_36861/g.73495 Transcript_36861/m.73495 type:complete len:895 (+) Transcript_36861:56-2740(+)